VNNMYNMYTATGYRTTSRPNIKASFIRTAHKRENKFHPSQLPSKT
jgi:hypothetical protein